MSLRALLPPSATRRITAAAKSQHWSSELSVGEEAALRAVGFVPVGVVTASTPSWPFPFRYPPAMRRRQLAPASRAVGLSLTPIDDALTAHRVGGFSRDYTSSSTATFLPDLGWSWQRVVHEHQQRQLFDATLDSLRTEAEGLGAHGIVGVRITAVHRDALTVGETAVHEVRAVGTAVRAPSSPPSSRLFIAATPAGHVAQLIQTGFAPSDAVFGIGIVRADLANLTRKRFRSLASGEVGQFSEAVHKSFTLAVADLEQRAARSGQLVTGCQPVVDFERVPGASLEVRVTVTGTAVCPFEAKTPIDVLPIMRLADPSP